MFFFAIHFFATHINVVCSSSVFFFFTEHIEIYCYSSYSVHRLIRKRLSEKMWKRKQLGKVIDHHIKYEKCNWEGNKNEKPRKKRVFFVSECFTSHDFIHQYTLFYSLKCTHTYTHLLSLKFPKWMKQIGFLPCSHPCFFCVFKNRFLCYGFSSSASFLMLTVCAFIC